MVSINFMTLFISLAEIIIFFEIIFQFTTKNCSKMPDSPSNKDYHKNGNRSFYTELYFD